MKMFKIILATFAVVALSGCAVTQTENSTADTDVPKNDDTVSVVASFYPIAYFAKEIGGDQVQVTNLTEGVEPHSFELSPRQVAEIESANLFIYNGYSLDVWAEEIAGEISAPTVNIAKNVLGEPDEDHEDEDEHDDHAHETDEDEHGHDHAQDPHLWLDPQLAIEYIEEIELNLIKIDGKNAELYSDNAAKIKKEIEMLDDQIADQLRSCSRRDVVVQHDAFEYFSRQYNVNTLPIAGISPAQEPTASALAELTGVIKDRGITHILFEERASSQVANTLADETGIKTLSVSTLESAPAGSKYVDIMKENAQVFATALGCS